MINAYLLKIIPRLYVIIEIIVLFYNKNFRKQQIIRLQNKTMVTSSTTQVFLLLHREFLQIFFVKRNNSVSYKQSNIEIVKNSKAAKLIK